MLCHTTMTNIQSIMILYTISKYYNRGGSRGGAHPARAPPKIGKKMIFWRKIVVFHTNYSKNVRASLRSAQFFKYAPLTWNPGSAPAIVFSIVNENEHISRRCNTQQENNTCAVHLQNYLSEWNDLLIMLYTPFFLLFSSSFYLKRFSYS